MSLEPYVSEYAINPFPQDRNNGHHWQIQIRLQSDGYWAIRNSGFWLQPDGSWYPDLRSALQFPELGITVATAQEALKAIDVNGVTWDGMVAKWGTP